MIYYYRFDEVPKKAPHEYYETHEIQQIPLYEETPEILADWLLNDRSEYWPVHDPDGPSTEAKQYSRKDEARLDLGVSLNQTVYEYRCDI